MASTGFSAPKNYWGDITGLTPKNSNSGTTYNVVTASGATNDVVASDRTGPVLAPSVEYAVTADFTNANSPIRLGKIVTFTEAGTTYYFMMAVVTVRTSAGSPPTVTIEGVQVESGATTKRTYPVSISLSPRSKAQDVATAFSLSNVSLNSCDTVYAIDPVVQTIGGSPAVHDVANGRIEATATAVQTSGSGSCTKSDGFDVFTQDAQSRQDAAYISRSIQSVKYLSGTDL